MKKSVLLSAFLLLAACLTTVDLTAAVMPYFIKNAAEIYANAVEAIYIADGYCDNGNYEKAKETLDTVDATILKEKIRGRYDSVKAEINNNID